MLSVGWKTVASLAKLLVVAGNTSSNIAVFVDKSGAGSAIVASRSSSKSVVISNKSISGKLKSPSNC